MQSKITEDCPRILVAGIGNTFLGDDAFGVEVVRQLVRRPLPPGVVVVDYGIRGLDLAFALLDPWDLVLFVDAAPRGGTPGTVYLIEPDFATMNVETPAMDSHTMNPLHVLHIVRSMGGSMPKLRIIGCEPKTIGYEIEPIMGLSEPVERAVPDAIDMVEEQIEHAATRRSTVDESQATATSTPLHK